MAFGWLPSDIEAQDYGTIRRVIALVNERAAGRESKAKESEFNRRIIEERRKRGMA